MDVSLNNFFDISVGEYLINAGTKTGNFQREVCDYIARKQTIEKSIKQLGLEYIYEQIEKPLINLLFEMEENGFKITYLDVDKYGFINFAQLLGAITPETILISIMSANNEIGTIQNIKAIAQTAKEKNIIFHTDAVQLYGHMTIDCEDIGIDALTISAHKIYGPKGVGALYVSSKVAIEPYHFGGEQERGKRGGTVNVAGAP